MRRAVLASSVVGLALGCGAAPTDDPRVLLPSTDPGSAIAPDGTLATFEGAFDQASGEVTVVFRQRDTGELLSESVLPYGNTAGNVFLHTEGVGGDGHAPPSSDGSVLTAAVNAENLTGQWVSGFTANITSITASDAGGTAGMVVGASTSCTGPLIAGTTYGAPCAITYGAVADDAAFPTLSFASSRSWQFAFANTSSFTFSGNVSGTVAATAACTADADCPTSDCVCANSGACAGNTGTCGAGMQVFNVQTDSTANVFHASAFPGCTSVRFDAWGAAGANGQAAITFVGGSGAYVGGSFAGLTASSTINVWIGSGGGAPNGGAGFSGTGASTTGVPAYGGAGGMGVIPSCIMNPVPPCTPVVTPVAAGGGGGGLTTIAFGASTVKVGAGGGGGALGFGYGGSEHAQSGGAATSAGMAGQSDGTAPLAGGGGGAGLTGGGGGLEPEGGGGGSSSSGPGLTVIAGHSPTNPPVGSVAPNSGLADYSLCGPYIGRDIDSQYTGGSGCVVIRCN